MRLRREAGLGIGAILTVQIFLSMLAIVLLSRMSPAIERILQENVYSGEAVEEMLTVLATTPSSSAIPERFDMALERAKANVTEDPELPLLETIEVRREAAFLLTPPEARVEVTRALRELGQINRASMNRADEQAQRLGQAGAWAAAILGALSLLLGIIVYRQLKLRLELPIEELRRATRHVRAGNLQARCAVMHDAPYEIQQISEDLNWILDQWFHQVDPHEPVEQVTSEERALDTRRLLIWLLDREERPVMIFNERDERVCMNRASLSCDVPPGLIDGEGWSVEDVPGTSLRIVTCQGELPTVEQEG